MAIHDVTGSAEEAAAPDVALAGPAQAVLERYRDTVTEGLMRAAELLPPEVSEPCEYHLGLGPGARHGKALRPVLTLLLGEGLAADPGWAKSLAAAVQLVHDFSLVHDDIVDQDASRRGRPALWARDGVPTALNAGDALLTVAFLVVAEAELPPDISRRAAASLGRATLEMVGGQQVDIGAAGDPAADLGAYLHMVELKTGALMGAASALGAIAAGAAPEVETACERFGRTLGVAFQLRDDTLGVFGDPEEIGKPVGNDLVRGKQGLPLLLALEAGGDLAETVRSWLPRSGLRREELPGAVELLRQRGVAERCQGLTTTWTERALIAAGRLPLEGPVGMELEILCRWLGERWS